MIWFTSDLHLGHTNIVGESVSRWKSGYRHFSSNEDMSQTIISNINSRVDKKDTLVICGDSFMYKTKTENQKWFDMITCENIILVIGNHDKRAKKHLSGRFKKIISDLIFRVEDDAVEGGSIPIHVYHYPVLSWNAKWAGKSPGRQWGWHLYGHTHDNSDSGHPDEGKFPVKNICVEHTNYAPISYKELRDNYFKKFVKFKG